MEKNNKNTSSEKMNEEFATTINSYLNDTIRKQYYKEWRKNNKDKIKKYNERFWKKQAEKIDNKNQ